MDILALDHVGLAVADIDRSVRWYQQVLGLRRAYQHAWGDYPAVLEKNGSGVALFPVAGEQSESAAVKSLAHVAFRVSRQGYEKARAELTAAGIALRETDHKVAWSIYLLDPDAHLIEIITYQPAWLSGRERSCHEH